MSIELLLYLLGSAAILAYSAYIDADEPMVFLFFSILWPIALAIAIPVLFGFMLRRLVKGESK